MDPRGPGKVIFFVDLVDDDFVVVVAAGLEYNWIRRQQEVIPTRFSMDIWECRHQRNFAWRRTCHPAPTQKPGTFSPGEACLPQISCFYNN